jgi:hypothetical protein
LAVSFSHAGVFSVGPVRTYKGFPESSATARAASLSKKPAGNPFRMVLHHPSGAIGPAGLFFGRSKENDIAPQRHMVAMQQQQRFEAGDS